MPEATALSSERDILVQEGKLGLITLDRVVSGGDCASQVGFSLDTLTLLKGPH